MANYEGAERTNYVSLSLNEIYERAGEKFGVPTDDISRAEY